MFFCGAARNCADDEEGLAAGRDGLWQRRIRRFVREILFACEEPHERPAGERLLVADRAAERRIARFERVEEGALCGRPLEIELHLVADACQRLQMLRKDHAHHDTVCTSTDRTAGRSRTIGAHVFPLFADAYTCPPVVPKYTPQESSESTAMASRRTFT